ncbi:MAG TPA: thioredoxin domain-containing protein [Rhizomicrobium sp.]|nr:thioredoxin domain-containing protein [Rhizomicrobium sp.]
MTPNNATSPYLLSHKDNQVQWRAWGPDAMAEAKAKDKAILLSLGYAGCHWCHVMARESFADPEIAAFLNENFIPVLVDRDERPDVDTLYQGAAGLMGHGGGWPLNIFLLPDGAPFWVAGYQPKDDKPETPSFSRVARDTAALWQNERARAEDTGVKVKAAVENLYNRDMTQPAEPLNIDLSALRVAQRFDVFFGGLLGTLKFPNPLLTDVLWRAFLRSGMPQFSQIIFTTLDSVLFGGVYDHIGGGFFRHALDERWLEPAFEKMLYDQAQMIEVCTNIFQFNRNELCRQRALETVAFLLREMKVGDVFAATISSGAQTEDARYYTWSEAEIDASLVGTFSARFKQVYGITRDGNIQGRNLPRRLGNPAPANEADEALLAKQRGMLLAVREKRHAPSRDDRVLADWNALLVTALARAGIIFDRRDWIDIAVKTFDEIVRTLGNGAKLSHVQGVDGFAEDYADMARAALQLWEVTGDQRFIAQARAWTQELNDHFWDNLRNGYAFYSDTADPLFVRQRMVFDNPTPSANGTMLVVLTRLALLTGERDYMSRASTLGATFPAEVTRMLNGSGGFLAGFEYLINALVIVVIGHKGNARTQDLVRAYWSKAMPNGMVMQIEPGDPLPPGHPASGRGMEGGQPTAYICQQGICSNPFTSALELANALTLPPQLRGQQQQQQVRAS